MFPFFRSMLALTAFSALALGQSTAHADCSFGQASNENVLNLSCQSVLVGDVDGGSQYGVQQASVCVSLQRPRPGVLLQGQFELKDATTGQVSKSQWQWASSAGDDMEWNGNLFAARSRPNRFFDFENTNRVVFSAEDNTLTLVQIQRHVPTGISKTKMSVKLQCQVVSP